MESLESFIKKRMRQSEQQAMMIKRYIELPNKFIAGEKKYTIKDVELYTKDYEECKMILDYYKSTRANKKIKLS